jgi:hypothetical protein
MQIAFISDVHDNLTSLTKVLNFLKKSSINFLVCCGDVGNLETISYLVKNFSGQIYLAFGNVEQDFINQDELNFSNLTSYPDFGKIELDGKKIAFCHFPHTARQLAEGSSTDFIFYGHTHQPKEEMLGKIKLVNPGNVAGLFFKPTFALYDTKTNDLELTLIDLI